MDVRKTDDTLIRVEKRSYKGRDFIDIRQYYQDDEGKFMPSGKGCTLPPEKLPEFIKAMEELLESMTEEVPV